MGRHLALFGAAVLAVALAPATAAPQGSDARPVEEPQTVQAAGPTTLHAVDTPIAGECDVLNSWRLAAAAAPELYWRGAVLPTETAYRTALGKIRLRHGRPESEMPVYFRTSAGPVDAWEQGMAHAVMVGDTQLDRSRSEQRMWSVSGPGPAVAFNRRLVTFNPAIDAVVVASRSPIDFDVVVSTPGRIYAFTSQALLPRWTQDFQSTQLALARFDVDRDGDQEAILSTSSVIALDAGTGAVTWTGQSSGFRGFDTGDLDGDGHPELILFGGSPPVAIYGGAPAVKIAEWAGGDAVDVSTGDGDGDGIDELVIATQAEQLVEIRLAPLRGRTLATGVSHRAIEHHRFAPDAPTVLAGVEGRTCEGDFVLRSPATGEVVARNARATRPERAATVGDLGGDRGAVLVHTTNLTATEAPSPGVRVVEVATRKTLFESPASWAEDRRFLADVATSDPRGSAPRRLWTIGTTFGPFRPWIAVDSLLDGTPLRYEPIASLSPWRAHGIHLLPSGPGLPDRVFLTTAGGTTSDNLLRGHWIDPDTLQPIGGPIVMGDALGAHVEIIDADADGAADIVVRTFGRIAVFALEGGALRWEASTPSGTTGMALLPAHDPPLVVHANLQAFPDNRSLVLRDARTGAVIDTVAIPVEPRVLGAVPGATDELLIGDYERIWRYALADGTASPLEPITGPGTGRRGTFPRVNADGKPALLIDGYHGYWSTRDLGIGELLVDSFEPAAR